MLYVSCGSKVRPRTFGFVAMGSALLFIVQIACIFCRGCFVWIRYTIVLFFPGKKIM